MQSRTGPGEVRSPELLAPAGHAEAFLAAVENGADAVYLGLKRLSARASAANFSLEELALLIPFAHRRSVSVYVALNSAVTEPERPELPALLEAVRNCGVDGLIVQDPGVFYMAHRFFPEIKLHASTLMAVHNHAGVRQLERMGAERVVLARELTLAEIESIASRTTVGLEVFVHGALCFGFSGLCMASSFRGGHGGLQGRCVQPCRLRFRQGRQEGFFLSCNDLCLIPMIPALKRLRIASFKLEGRMKSADAVAQIVRAYRHVLDASGEEEAAAVAEAQEWLARSPSRLLTLGYLAPDYQSRILTPHRSGTSGTMVGTIKELRGGRMVVALRGPLQPGDRLRPESGEGTEKDAFTVTKVLGMDGRELGQGRARERVQLDAPKGCRPGDRLFKVGSKTAGVQHAWRTIEREVGPGTRGKSSLPGHVHFDWGWLGAGREASPVGGWIVKVARVEEVLNAFECGARRVMLTATQANLERFARIHLNAARRRRFHWALPALIQEKDLDYYRAAVAWYLERGFRAWEVNNWGHFDFFPDRGGVNLVAGSRFNARNRAALRALREEGCAACVLSLEITRIELEALVVGMSESVELIVCVHAWPPLFTSRLVPRIQEHKPFLTPRGETYFLRKVGGGSQIYADRPVNWFEQLEDLAQLGYRTFLMDLSDGPHPESFPIRRMMSAAERGRWNEPCSRFNWDRRPV